MTREERILRKLTEEDGGLFYDTALRAMREFVKKDPLPPAEGAETIQPHITCPKCGSTNNSELAKNDRLCYDCNHSWSEQQPPAEGAEEILPAAYEWHNIKTGHCYVDYVPHLDAKDGYTKTPLYSTLHAQKIADKMVSERLRETTERCKKLEFMIDKGLGWKDMENDITMPHEL